MHKRQLIQTALVQKKERIPMIPDKRRSKVFIAWPKFNDATEEERIPFNVDSLATCYYCWDGLFKATHTHNKTFHHKNCAHRLKSLCIGSANERLKSAWFVHVTEWTVISFSIVRIFSRILIENKQFFFCFIKFNVLARDWGNHICLNLATQWQRDCVKW